MNLILASNSPRRRELLARLTPDFVVLPSGVDEAAAGSPGEQAVEAAKAKARAVGRIEHGMIIGADTVVVVDSEMLGKPGTRDEARMMLQRLSGHVHSVLTGLCVRNTETGEERTFCEETQVTFRTLGSKEIEAYLDTEEYHDKAGAYAIQGVAAKFIPQIHGDYANVMGLPLCRLTLLLRDLGVWL